MTFNWYFFAAVMIIGGVSAGVVYLWKNRTHNNEIMELKNKIAEQGNQINAAKLEHKMEIVELGNQLHDTKLENKMEIMDLEQKIRKEVRVELQEHVAVKMDQLEFHVDKKIFENQNTILEHVKKEIANILRDFMNDERLGASAALLQTYSKVFCTDIHLVLISQAYIYTKSIYLV